MAAALVHGPHVVFVIEGGRSRADVAALNAVAAAVQKAGATVTVVRHGLGRLSARTVRRAIRETAPNVVVTTGATSTRDAEALGRARGFAVVCYYWPAGPIEDIHRRPRHRHKAPRRPARVSVPTHAVLGSRLHLKALHQYLGIAPGSLEVHVLPPLIDEAAFAEATSTARSGPATIGVYGGHGRQLPAGEGYRWVDLDSAPAALLTSFDGFQDELCRLRACDAVLLCGCGTAEEREAPRRCATALLSGKPVLVSGFGESGDALPLLLDDLTLPGHGPLRAAPPDKLPQAVAQLVAELPELPQRAPSGLREALLPRQVLAHHAALILRIATKQPTRKKRGADSIATRLLARLRTLLKRQPPS